jgi:two-component system, chemotaxis family, CheB/CheR fusion protein
MRPSELDPQFVVFLDYLKRNRGFDFTGYKSSSVMRRVHKRMQTVGIDSYGDYIDYLEVHPDEFLHLFNTILINVTSFFRDAHAWRFLGEEIIPRILNAKPAGAPIRVWSAGCASGEEAFTIAVLLGEALGPVEYRDRVKIYATDVDEEALGQARQAAYASKHMEVVPPDLLEKYFDLQSGAYVFKKEYRRGVIFGRHDLLNDAPISRVDLLLCRNTLMYFNADSQARILARFHFALSETSFLFLGKAEMLFTHGSMFAPVDLRCRIFTKVHKGGARDRLLLMARAGNEEAVTTLEAHALVREAVFDAATTAQIVIDAAGSLAMANEQARRSFRLTQEDIGRPLQDLEISYRPVELRSCIERAAADRKPLVVQDVEWSPATGAAVYLDVHVRCLEDNDQGIIGTLVTFEDVTSSKRLREDLQGANQELEAAFEELQSSSEEVETTNEELQSTVEELETTNEELQSTNEELETMNEELQSTNEELQTINDELKQRSDELNQVNDFMASILTNLRSGVVVLDREMHVRVWSYRVEDMWGLRGDEVLGEHLMNLDIGLPVTELRQAIRDSLSGNNGVAEITLPATNRRGRSVLCKVTISPLDPRNSGGQGTILIMDEIPVDQA